MVCYKMYPFMSNPLMSILILPTNMHIPTAFIQNAYNAYWYLVRGWPLIVYTSILFVTHGMDLFKHSMAITTQSMVSNCLG